MSDRRGLVRTADGGTLFLDEIGELPAPSQAALLRVLQEREVVPVGEDRPVAVDLRVIAATLCDLSAAVAQGRFRADLLARISGHVFSLPPLRERCEDLGLLIGRMLPRGPGGEVLRVAPAVLRALLRHDWPCNIRELEKVLEITSALAEGGVIELEDLPEHLWMTREAAAASMPAPGDLADRDRLARRVRRRPACAVAARAAANQTRAAALLSVPVRTFSEKVKQHGLSTKNRRDIQSHHLLHLNGRAL